MATGVGQI